MLKRESSHINARGWRWKLACGGAKLVRKTEIKFRLQTLRKIIAVAVLLKSGKRYWVLLL